MPLNAAPALLLITACVLHESDRDYIRTAGSARPGHGRVRRAHLRAAGPDPAIQPLALIAGRHRGGEHDSRSLELGIGQSAGR